MQDLLRRENLLLLDTWDRASHERGHIPSAMHASTAKIESLIMGVPKNTPILLYCYHGSASLAHGQILVDFGFREVYSLNGGYEGWMRFCEGSRLEKWLEAYARKPCAA